MKVKMSIYVDWVRSVALYYELIAKKSFAHRWLTLKQNLGFKAGGFGQVVPLMRFIYVVKNEYYPLGRTVISFISLFSIFW